MADGFRIEVEGLEELRNDLALMAPELDREIEVALGVGARIVARQANVNAPRRSGRLAGSIRPFTEGGNVGAVEVTARRRSARWPAGYGYPRRIEFRHDPFLRRAVEQMKDEVISSISAALDVVIQRLWRS